MRVYDYKHDTIERLCKEIKDGVNATTTNFSDSTARGTLSGTKLLKKDNDNLGISLSREQMQAINIPRTQQSLAAYGWLKCHFELVGDDMPNKDEVHLEPCNRTEIDAEYLSDMVADAFSFVEPLTYERFCFLWDEVFPFVKIRMFKAVTGKCFCCAKLSDAMKKHKSERFRE